MKTLSLFDDAPPAENKKATADVESVNLEDLPALLEGCRRCALHEKATQVVGGQGPTHARLVLVGEQPGNDEDLVGLPFVGPAGRLLSKALLTAGINREEIYLTNAVKHFKWIPSGKRRLHQKPGATEIRACKPWLITELTQIQPRLIVCLGATAAQALMGPSFRVTQELGRIQKSPYGQMMATLHPSAVLRMPDEETQKTALRGLIFNLRDAWLFASDTKPTHEFCAEAREPAH